MKKRSTIRIGRLIQQAHCNKTMCLFLFKVFIFGHHCIKIGHLLKGAHDTNFHNYL